jgi:hypothetical protein
MSLDAKSHTRPGRTTATASLARVRRGSLAVLVLLVVEYGIGMYVNLYVTIPRTGHGRSVGSELAGGPAMLSVHAVIGLLLGLGALGVFVEAVMARHPVAIALSALGLFALAFASATGASFASSGDPADSMGMAVLTGIGLLCYAANLYVLSPPAVGGWVYRGWTQEPGASKGRP